MIEPGDAHLPYGSSYATVGRVARKQVLVQLDDSLVELLDTVAGTTGLSRSELIRRAIAGHLRDLEWAEQDRVAVDSYRTSPETWTGSGWPEE